MLLDSYSCTLARYRLGMEVLNVLLKILETKIIHPASALLGILFLCVVIYSHQ